VVHGPAISVGFTSFYHEANYLSSIYDQRTTDFRLTFGKEFAPSSTARSAIGWKSVDTFNVVVTASPQLLAETGPSPRGLYCNLTWDRRDNPFLTRSGERITYTWWWLVPADRADLWLRCRGIQILASAVDTILLVNAEVAGVIAGGPNQAGKDLRSLFLAAPTSPRI